ncbi:MAG: FecR domain-containing protein [Duganella sp.]
MSKHYVTLQQAAQWYALLQSEAASDEDRLKWQRWIAADPLHAATWAQVEEISGQFRSMPQAPARAALLRSGAHGRRVFAAMLVASVGAAVLWRAGSGQWWGTSTSSDQVADLAEARYDAAVGQLRQLRLPDGGLLELDTDSAVDIAYSAEARRIVLRRGRIHVRTGADPQLPARPLLVETGQGMLRALGTRFEVTALAGLTRLSVTQGAVEITPRHGRAQVLAAGQQAQFDASAITAPQPVAEQAPSWTRRIIVADNMRLDDFVQALSPYRRGYLACAPEVAQLRLVGAYPLDDHEAVFAMLEASLPVRVQRLMPWWVTITARHGAS